MSEPEFNYYGTWVSTGVYASQGPRVVFSENGDVTLSSATEKAVTVASKVETFDEWFDRLEHNLNMSRQQAHDIYPGVTHVVTPQVPEGHGKPFYYRASDDKLIMLLDLEFRRQN